MRSKSWFKIVGIKAIKEVKSIACAVLSALQTSYQGGGVGDVGGELIFIKRSI